MHMFNKIIQLFFTAYGLVWAAIIIIVLIFCVFMLPKVIYDRKKNKEDDYYSKNVKR